MQFCAHKDKMYSVHESRCVSECVSRKQFVKKVTTSEDTAKNQLILVVRLGSERNLMSGSELLECNDNIDPHPPNLSLPQP